MSPPPGSHASGILGCFTGAGRKEESTDVSPVWRGVVQVYVTALPRAGIHAPKPESRMPRYRDRPRPPWPPQRGGCPLTCKGHQDGHAHPGRQQDCCQAAQTWRDPGILNFCEPQSPLYQPAPSQGCARGHEMNGAPAVPGAGHHGKCCVTRSNISLYASLIASLG